MSCAIRVEGLQKSYAGRAVLKGLTFTVEQGEIFALLGVNGAGKTTALECIEGLRRQDGGSAVVWGKAGIQLQSASLPAHIRPMEAVALFAKWNGTKPDAAMLDALGIGGMKKTQYGALSTGQSGGCILHLRSPEGRTWYFWMNPQPGWTWRGGWRSTRRSAHCRRRGKPSSWPAMIWRRWKACAAASAS